MRHTAFLADIARQWVESDTLTERTELLLQVRDATQVKTDGELIALLLESLHAENERANQQEARAENWFRMWRSKVAPPGAQDKRRNKQKTA